MYYVRLCVCMHVCIVYVCMYVLRICVVFVICQYAVHYVSKDYHNHHHKTPCGTTLDSKLNFHEYIYMGYIFFQSVRILYLNTQSVPRSKHTPSRLYKLVS